MSTAGEQGPLAGRVIVVTGGGRGIGAAYSARLAAHGARVVVNDAGVAGDGRPTTEDPAEAVVAGILAAGGEALAHRGDIGATTTGDELVTLALDTWGRLDGVVNNAGFGRPRMVFNLADDEFDDVVRVHLRGTFGLTRAACRHWRSEAKAGRNGSGRIINTATGLLLHGGAGQSNYVAAKAGILALTEAIATEMAPYGVTANTIMPSANTRLAQVGWRMERNAAERRNEGFTFDVTDPVHVAEFGCYLLSPAAAWISGQTFQVRGGIIEHVATYAVDHRITRHDRGWTLGDLTGEMPRMFGAGARRADPPPADWRRDGPQAPA